MITKVINKTLTFSPAQTEFNITLAIRDDDVVEDLEDFRIHAELADDDTSRIKIIPESSQIVIEDENGKLILHSAHFSPQDRH